MSRYRTEILIPSDRVVTLHLPEDYPTGTARVTIEFLAPDEVGSVLPDPDDVSDIEWWEEFGDDPDGHDDEAWDLGVRLSTLEP